MRRMLCLALVMLLASCASSMVDPNKQIQLANVHYRLGMDALGKTGMLPKAFHELMRSDAILPDQPAVLDALAYAWLLRGDMKKSESYYLRAIHHGAGAATFSNYANLLNHLKRYPEAEKAARKALDDPRYPNQDLAFINLGDALLGQQKFDVAITAYKQAQVFNPDSSFVNLRLAQAYFKYNKLREARVLFEMLILKQADNRPAVEGIIAVMEKQQNKASARTVLNQFIAHASVPLDKAWAQNELDRLKSQ